MKMKNQCINELHRFDIRDHNWSVVSRTEKDLRIHVLGDGSGWEFGGEPFTDLFVTFRNFRLKWAKTIDGDEDLPLTFAEAMDRFSAEIYFVFAYYLDEDGIEMCGLGSDAPLAMNFSFDETFIEWDYVPKDYVGKLRIL